jgi:hypothetical protein
LGSILGGRTDPSSDMVARLAAYLQRSPDDVKVWLRESDWGENLPGASPLYPRNSATMSH